jgi:hypothetical protein
MESAALVVPVVVSDMPLQAVQQPRCGRFSAGIERLPETPAKGRIGCFSDGMRHRPARLRVGRFSDGMERAPGTPGSLRSGSFADGYQRTV